MNENKVDTLTKPFIVSRAIDIEIRRLTFESFSHRPYFHVCSLPVLVTH